MRSLEENMLRHAWCGSATDWIRALSREEQLQLLTKLSPELAEQWRELLGLSDGET